MSQDINAIIQSFKEHQENNGFHTKKTIVPDGKIHRVHLQGDTRGTLNGSYLLHADGVPNGWFQDMKQDATPNKWTMKGVKTTPFSAAEKQAFEVKKQAKKVESDNIHKAAAELAKSTYESLPVGNLEGHGYSITKGVETLGDDVRRGKIQFNGMTFNDALVVPIKDVHGSVKTLQVIDSKGGKYLLTNGEKAGNFLTFGDIHTAKEIIIAEGVATAGAIKQCTNSTVVAAIDAGNLKAVAINIRAVNPTAKIVMAADDDIKQGSSSNRGITDATAAAQAVNGYVAIPEMNGEKCDFWDVYNVLGHQAVSNALMHAKLKENQQSTLPTDETGLRVGTDTSTPKEKNKFKLMSVGELLKREFKPEWQVFGLFEKGNLIHVFGESAGGKSTLVQDLSFCVSTGIDFHGKPTKKGNVIYIAGEGFAGLNKRFKALVTHYGIDSQGLFISEQPAAFMDFESVESILEAIESIEGGADLIIIDTMHRNMGAGDENSAKDVATMLNNVDYLKAKTGASILIVHHCGHTNQERARGSSSIKAAMDVEFQVIKKDDVVTVINTKMKDFEPPKPMAFKVKQINLDDGLNSIVLDSIDYADAKFKKISERETEILTHIKNALEVHGKPPTQPIPQWLGESPTTVLTTSDLRKFIYEAENAISKTAKDTIAKAVARAIPNLTKDNYINNSGDYVWWID